MLIDYIQRLLGPNMSLQTILTLLTISHKYQHQTFMRHREHTSHKAIALGLMRKADGHTISFVPL